MNWLEKQKILNTKDVRRKEILKSIINNSEVKKLSEYDKLAYDLVDKGYLLLEEIDYILDNKSFTLCKTFPLIFPEIVKMDSCYRVENFGNLINLCAEISDLKFKLYVYFKFLSFDNRQKEEQLYNFIKEANLDSLDYEKIIYSVFENNDTKWIELFVENICSIINKHGYNEKLFDKLIKIENIDCLDFLCNIVYRNYDNEYIDKLIEVTDVERLNLIAEVVFDDDLKRTKYYNYIVDMMFNVDKEKLIYLVDIALDNSFINLNNYKEIMELIFSIKDERKLININELITNHDSIHFGKVINKAIKINNIELLEEFNLITNKISDKNILKILELDFENDKIIDVIRKINKIFSMMKSDVILTKEEVLNIVFNKILVVENYDNMLLLLEELVKQINLYSAKSLYVSNSMQVNSIIDEKINDFNGKQLVKNIKCENKEA